MLFILTGDVQIGKTRWLQKLASELAADGVPCAGVIAPGRWVPSENGDENGFEKLGIDNVLLPQNERIAFARRRDLAQADGTFDPKSQSAQMQLRWEISDKAIAQVNDHFDQIARDVCARAGAPSAPQAGLLIVDELGRLELSRGQGLASALAILDAGPTPAFPHALIVVRKALLDQAEERFAPTWESICPIGPAADARAKVRRAFGLAS